MGNTVPLDKTYNPAEIEARHYEQWEKSGVFGSGLTRAPNKAPTGDPYTIVIPPPNVTGSLHMGHALNNTLQDILTRYHRMRGRDTLWQPGTDHAGIATQMVVERQLAEQGIEIDRGMGASKENMTLIDRPAFIDKVWQWKAESGGTITGQLRRLGASCDWSRERFTMDEGLSRAVRKVFVELHRQGLIYRDKRLVNWDPKLHTAISDLEVEQRELTGSLWYFKYPIEGAEGQYITVATTRPETMLGDTAVAVHPEDERYTALVGKYVVLPLVGRRIPIIADDYSDPEKGSGAVKITPAHDFNDFEVGQRHGLDKVNVLDPDAKISIKENRDFWENTTFSDQFDGAEEVLKNLGGFHEDEDGIGYKDYALDDHPDLERLRNLDGLDRFDARKKIVEMMEQAALLEKIEDNEMSVPYGDRSGVVIEPWLTDQWYVDAKTLAEPAVRAVEEGATKFVPKHWENTYYEWMRNIQPWCISRQIWWGHQIPVWYGPDGGLFCETSEEEAIAAAEIKYGRKVKVIGEKEYLFEVLSGTNLDGDRQEFIGSVVPIHRDADVLDTWFSSALWPFSTLGWPDETPELARYYPTDVLVTGFDIIFFWVARMMMMGLHFMDEVPFHTVYIHALVRDEQGQKMSKSKGNVLDPLDLIDQYTADSLRFTLTAMAAQGRDIKLSTGRIEGYRNFITKIWNAARYAEMNECQSDPSFDPASCKQVVNQWIVGAAAETEAKVSAALDDYRFNDAANAIYQFAWHSFCDWYLEFTKPILMGDDAAAIAETRATTSWALEQVLLLLHPISPFVTEELWEKLAPAEGRAGPLITASWPVIPQNDGMKDATDEMGWVIRLISEIRAVRTEMNVPAGAKVPVLVQGASEMTQSRLNRHQELILRLARVESFGSVENETPSGAVQAVVDEATFFMQVGDVIDISQEKERLEREISKVRVEIEKLQKKLGNEKFTSRAPAEVVEENRERLAEFELSVSKLTEALDRLSSL